MDMHPLHQQPTTNDEELARVLASADDEQGQNAAAMPASDATPGSTLPQDDGAQSAQASAAPMPTDLASVTARSPLPGSDALATTPGAHAATGGAATPLDSLKQAALEELRPLVDQLNLPAEEKFDTLLLIIRSTDDQSLLTTAHEAAKQITDETRRAQALLDIIKEIDYFSQPEQAAA